MKPPPFAYQAAENVEQVVQLLAEYGNEARLLAGGQSLIAWLNFRRLNPAVIVDLNPVESLDYVRAVGDEILIGAMTRQRTLEFDALIEAHVPLMHAAVPFLAHPAIRNRGTIGGSLAYADPAAEQPTVTTALGGRYKLCSAKGERWVAAEDFFDRIYQPKIASDEIMVEIAVPKISGRSGWGFREVARRHGDRVMMGVAVMVALDADGICREARLVYQNAAEKPLLASGAASLLIGEKPTPELFSAAAEKAAQTEIDPMESIQASESYIRKLAKELTGRVLADAFERAAARNE
ncbi:MAG: FAD binding domain-containing protein [Anaerolineales bacterium]|nr:FAD binding domain-containing protein [Anaerolineales bacterium]